MESYRNLSEIWCRKTNGTLGSFGVDRILMWKLIGSGCGNSSDCRIYWSMYRFLRIFLGPDSNWHIILAKETRIPIIQRNPIGSNNGKMLKDSNNRISLEIHRNPTVGSVGDSAPGFRSDFVGWSDPTRSDGVRYRIHWPGINRSMQNLSI